MFVLAESDLFFSPGPALVWLRRRPGSSMHSLSSRISQLRKQGFWNLLQGECFSLSILLLKKRPQNVLFCFFQVHWQIFELVFFVLLGLYKARVNWKPEPRTKDCLRRTGLRNIYKVRQWFQTTFYYYLNNCPRLVDKFWLWYLRWFCYFLSNLNNP